MIAFNCTCGEPLAAAVEHAGLQVQCPKCNARLTIPVAEEEFEYADDPAPPPPKKKPVRVEDDNEPTRSSNKKKARLVDEDEAPRRKKRRRRNYGDDDEPEHVRRLMARANAELDEEEARHAREGGGIHFTPGIIAGSISIMLGLLLLVVMVCIGFINFYVLVLCGLLIVGGGVRVVLSFLGQGTD